MPAEKDKPFKDDQTEKRIHEHLTNEKDQISDEDIDNVKTNIAGETSNGSPQAAENKSPVNKQSETPGSTKKDDGEEPRIETPWNILK